MKFPAYLTVALVSLLMLWAGATQDDWRGAYLVRTQQVDYYNRLVDGFLEGHLHMKVAPEPSGQMPFLLDASLYQGKYYLYFSAVPAIALFLPYTVLTGHDLPSNTATLLLVFGGFLLTLRLYALARRRYFPSLGPAWDVCSIWLLAFGSSTPILLFNGGVYQVAISSGYLCAAGTLLCLYHAIHSQRHPLRWLAFTSFMAGLTIACRPNYLVALPIVLGPMFFRLWALRSGCLWPARTAVVRMLGAALIPAAALGVALMAYNHQRFGDPFELGLNYQVGSIAGTGHAYLKTEFIWPNLRWYYGTPPVVSPFFPYVLPINATDRPAGYFGYELLHGQWLTLVLGVLTLVAALRLKLSRQVWPRELAWFVSLTLLAFACIVVMLSAHGGRANRYVVDFQGFLAPAIVLIGGYCAAHWPAAAPRGRNLFRLGFCSLAATSAVFNFLLGLQWMDCLANTRPQTYRALAYYGNYPSHWLAKCGWQNHGTYRFRVKFKPQTRAAIEPLLITGAANYTDILYATQHPNGYCEFSMVHEGQGGNRTGLIKIDYTKEYEVEVKMGSLFPPVHHPYFRGWSEADIRRLKTTVAVTLDGQPIISGQQKFFDAPPSAIFFGQNPWTKHQTFSGKISSIEFHPLSPEAARAVPTEFGVWRLETVFPPSRGPGFQPLLAAGYSGHGHLLSCEFINPTTIRLSLDQWGVGMTCSDPIPVEPMRPYLLEVFAGPQVARQNIPAAWAISPADIQNEASKLKVWLDGQLVWITTLQAHPDAFTDTTVGFNAQGFSNAAYSFNGTIKKLPLDEAQQKELLLRNLAVDRFGIWRLDLILPRSTERGFQPILASGRQGYGNLLSVEYLSSHSIRLGHDEWGTPMSYSDPIPVDPRQTQRLEVFVGPQIARQTMPAAWAVSAADVAAHARLLQVWLNDRLVWITPIRAHHDTYDDAIVGQNTQGFSSATTQFGGTIWQVPFMGAERKKSLERNLELSPPAIAN